MVEWEGKADISAESGDEREMRFQLKVPMARKYI